MCVKVLSNEVRVYIFHGQFWSYLQLLLVGVMCVAGRWVCEERVSYFVRVELV